MSKKRSLSEETKEKSLNDAPQEEHKSKRLKKSNSADFEKKPDKEKKERKRKTRGSLKLKGMVAKGKGKNLEFVKEADAAEALKTAEDQLDQRCKQKGDKFCM
eukprot:TRINITY_DN27806_c0_g1_i1.p1 TRINITY_DN27806_c0_g1~~TRINITY_DN27806_c0_g1_i1.p1  ORF type:complete len:103 (-),score=37.51 TRINITY_DN27806_c0_g1_i1:42-350(-)